MQAIIIAGRDTLSEETPAKYVAEQIIGGLSLLQRAARAAQRAGAERLLVFAAEDLSRETLEGDEHLNLPIEWRTHRRAFDDLRPVLLENEDSIEARFWLVPADRLVSPQHFVPDEDEASPCVRVCDLNDDPVGVWLLSREPLLAMLREADELETGLDRLFADQGQDVQAKGGIWHMARTPKEAAAALDALMGSLRKPLGRNADGLTAYYINRPISLAMSRYLVNTSLTPNQVTSFALFLGLLGAVFASTGVWAGMAFGGFLLQWSSILDGVDGELARLRLTTSFSGEWFDTVCDDLINLSFLTGLGYGASKVLGTSWPMFLAWLGFAAGFATVIAFYRILIREGVASHNSFEWGFEDKDAIKSKFLGAIVRGFGYIAKRDSYNLLMALLLVLNLPVIASVTMSVGTLVVGVAAFVQLRGSDA